MDGTFYLGNRILDGSLEFIEKLRETGRDFLFFTNNASKTSEFYIKKLAGMGCEITAKNIATAGDVTIEYLLENYPSKSIYLVGTPLLEEEFERKGIKLVQEDPDIVVVSFDLTLTYEKLSKACTYIRNGSEFIATHMDINCPTEDGFIPDCGSICAAVTTSTGVKPRYLGKPFKETIEMIERITGHRKEDMAIIGDRLYTDIAIGFKNGVTSILVLSGETKIEDLKESDIKPDYVFSSLKSIIEWL
ncbi:MAG: HAD-IIA family hydrolase [Clostridiaceae bacterium]|nr:HAD-IIA family hydrolase [Clostridiaceae bacterium]